MKDGWIKTTEQQPPLGICLEVLTVNHMSEDKIEHKYPVWRLQKPYECGYGYFFGGLDNELLKDFSDVVAWRPMHAALQNIGLMSEIRAGESLKKYK